MEDRQNGVCVKKFCPNGLDVYSKFSMVWVSQPTFLMGCMEKSHPQFHFLLIYHQFYFLFLFLRN
jgi:hypothetical protein